jgi:hypothetical protein
VGWSWCEDFFEKYKSLCEFTSVELAEIDHLTKKNLRVENQKREKVPCILFDTWAVPASK